MPRTALQRKPFDAHQCKAGKILRRMRLKTLLGRAGIANARLYRCRRKLAQPCIFLDNPTMNVVGCPG